jgi:hypothetical protein
MTQIITGRFDGKVIIPDRPVKLPIGKRLRIRVTVDASKKNGKIEKKVAEKGQFIGTGKYHSGIPDLATNKKYLAGFGRS